MTNEQKAAQEFAPAPATKKTQQAKILDTIAKQGWISKWGAIYDVSLHCSKLSTRIGEIEERCGHRFDRERIYQADGNGGRYFVGMRYKLPKGLTIEDFKGGRN